MSDRPAQTRTFAADEAIGVYDDAATRSLRNLTKLLDATKLPWLEQELPAIHPPAEGIHGAESGL